MCLIRDPSLTFVYLTLQVEAKMAELQQQYTEKLKQKEELKEKAEHTEKMLDRASKLVSGLAGERERYKRKGSGPRSNLVPRSQF